MFVYTNLNSSTEHKFDYSQTYRCGRIVILTGPDFLLGETVKSGQNSRSCRERGIIIEGVWHSWIVGGLLIPQDYARKHLTSVFEMRDLCPSTNGRNQ